MEKGSVYWDSVMAANDVLQKFETTELVHPIFDGGARRVVSFI